MMPESVKTESEESTSKSSALKSVAFLGLVSLCSDVI